MTALIVSPPELCCFCYNKVWKRKDVKYLFTLGPGRILSFLEQVVGGMWNGEQR